MATVCDFVVAKGAWILDLLDALTALPTTVNGDQRNLGYIIHPNADVDAVASAYLLSRIVPGKIGFPDSNPKRNAAALLARLGVEPIPVADAESFDFAVFVDAPSKWTGVGRDGPPSTPYAWIDHGHGPESDEIASGRRRLPDKRP